MAGDNRAMAMLIVEFVRIADKIDEEPDNPLAEDLLIVSREFFQWQASRLVKPGDEKLALVVGHVEECVRSKYPAYEEVWKRIYG